MMDKTNPNGAVRRKMGKAGLGLVLGLVLGFSGTRDYRPSFSPKKSKRQPLVDEHIGKLVVEKARSFLENPYFTVEQPDSLSCIDVVVGAYDPVDGSRKRMSESYQANPSFFTNLDMRDQSGLERNAKWLLTLVTGDGNNPSNPYFTRRLANFLAYQSNGETFFTPDQVPNPSPGMCVYYCKPQESFPSHIGIISGILPNGDFSVIQASSSQNKVIESANQAYMQKVGGLEVFGYGIPHPDLTKLN